MNQHDARNDTAPSPEESRSSEASLQQEAKVAEGDPTQAELDAAAEQVDEVSAAEADAELRAARDEVAQLKDQYIRTQAEMDNVRKRAEREVDAARKFGIEKFAKELLGVRDSLDAGLASANEAGADLEKLREGMELTERMLDQAMGKFGVELVNPEGEPFDPDYHEAMSLLPSSDHAPNTVVTVIQKGYLLNGRVLRPAMVVVSSAAPEGDDK